jgi:tRNA-2-methylthio-N6-dimethylallyladenosine synthase
MPRRFHVYTVGCQMNVLDSELAAAELVRAGHEQVGSLDEADLILLNTCSVRCHAEDKIYSLLGRLRPLKEQRPGLLIGVLGCMAQKDRQEILRRAPHVDLVVGPGRLDRLPVLVEQAAAGAGPQVEVSLDRVGRDRASVERSFVPFSPPRTATPRTVPPQAFVRIMFGCDQFCSYCVVPRLRGPEQSRPAAEICEEVGRLADVGCLEVTLLGQAVNRYRDPSSSGHVGLADLLYRLHDIDGIRRLRFVTNHPAAMTDDLVAAVRDLSKVSPYLHVPAQSGSDAVLKRMNRGYTAGQYREMLARIREAVPRAAITSDFIVGFCGETEKDFEQTADLVRDARFKNSFIFKYSNRPGTKAAELFADDVPEAVKRRRNNDLLAIQNAICLEDNQAYLGRSVEILVEGPSKTAKKRHGKSHPGHVAEGEGTNSPHPSPLPKGERTVQLTGRTVCDRIVVFDGPMELVGHIVPVAIERVDAFTLFGKAISCSPSHPNCGSPCGSSRSRLPAAAVPADKTSTR